VTPVDVTPVDVAVVGGGPAGAIVASQLATAGFEVALLERAVEPHWRACGVFSSPASVRALRRVGLDAATLSAASQPIPAMRVETPGGATFRLTYGDDGSLAVPAVGYDRAALDGALLDLARARGAAVRTGVVVTAVQLPVRAGGRSTLAIRTPDGDAVLDAAVVVGADGIRSTVARAAGVVRQAPLGPRVGLTWHLADPRPDEPRDARMIVLDGAYCGLAPVPGRRVNIGIVLATPAWRERLARDGAAAVSQRILGAVPRTADDPTDWSLAEPCDAIAGAAPLGHRVRHRAGEGWLLIGDAAGFLDPFTGEGLHRAIVSAELASEAVERHLAGARDALAAYDRRMTQRFATKDLVTRIVQAFLASPPVFEYAARRLASRPAVRETMGLVMGDLVPAWRALDPRFLTALLRP
jgi:menaquinone-9 beta-reductase